MVIVMGSVYATNYHSSKEKNEKFNDFIKNYQKNEFYNSFLTTNFMNGELFIHFSYQTNHNGSSVSQIIELFKFDLPQMLGKSAFGSLYVYDDEGQRKVDEFELYILRKGKVVMEKDIYFSPFSQKVSPDCISQL